MSWNIGAIQTGGIDIGAVQYTPSSGPTTYILKDNNSDNLNLTTSWVGGVVPTSANIAEWNNTVLSANTTILSADASWLGIQIINPGGLITINSGNTLTIGSSGIDLLSATQNLTLNCGITLGNNQDWNITQNRTLIVSGIVGGSSNVNKIGGGTVYLYGNNSYTGTTTLTSGSLYVSGSISSGSSVSINGGTLGGGGFIYGSLSANSGGTISPGYYNTSAISSLKASTVTFTSGAIFSPYLNYSVPTSSQLSASGNVTLGNGTLTINPFQSVSAGIVYTIITGSSISGTFNGLSNSATFIQQGRSLRIVYTATNVTLTDITSTVTGNWFLLQMRNELYNTRYGSL